jgi:hypothetical protein
MLMTMFKVSVRKPASSVSLSIPPRQKIVDPIDRVVDDTAENISQPSLRIDASELGRFDQRVGNSCLLSSALRTSKKLIVALESYTPHATLSRIVVDAEASIVEIGSQSFEPRQAISNGSNQF